MTQPLVSRPTVISDGVWLGAGCIVLKGVTIGRNTVVGAGSVVVHDLPADSIAVGRAGPRGAQALGSDLPA